MPSAAIYDCEGARLSADERAFFRDADPWGFIVFARNLETPDQIRALTASLRDTVGRDAPILIDQEGGRVQRLRPFPLRQGDSTAGRCRPDLGACRHGLLCGRRPGSHRGLAERFAAPRTAEIASIRVANTGS